MSETEKTVTKTRLNLASAVGCLALLVVSFAMTAVLAGDPFGMGFGLAGVRIGAALFGALILAVLLLWLDLLQKSVWWWCPLVLGVLSASLLFGLSLYAVAAVVCASASALVLKMCVLKKQSRVFCAVCLAALMLVALLGMACIASHHKWQSVDASKMLSAVQERIDRLGNNLTLLTVENEEGEIVRLLKDDAITSLKNGLLMSLPGLLLLVLFVYGYAATFVLRLLLKYRGMLSLLYADGFLPAATMVSAAVFGACLICTSLLSGVLSVPLYATASALRSVLEALFCAIGYSAFVQSRRRRKLRGLHRRNYTFWLLLAFGFFGYGLPLLWQHGLAALVSLLPIVALAASLVYQLLYFYGLFHTIFQALKNKQERSDRDEKGMGQ